jgi:hypothetical protein
MDVPGFLLGRIDEARLAIVSQCSVSRLLDFSTRSLAISPAHFVSSMPLLSLAARNEDAADRRLKMGIRTRRRSAARLRRPLANHYPVRQRRWPVRRHSHVILRRDTFVLCGNNEVI